MIYLVPFAVQGVLMGVDEFYFHHRRDLRRWERWGHPLDTLFFLGCLSVLWFTPSPFARAVYAGLAIANCVFITKDEWEHRRLCTGGEQWLHALLFGLHPVLLACLGWLWWTGAAEFGFVFHRVVGLAAAFLLYQIIYWNVWRRDQQ